MNAQSFMHLNLHGKTGPLSRRGFLQLSSAAGAGVMGSSFLSQIGISAEQLKKEQRACILVWLAGGPSQLDTFDPKPGTPNGGATKSIKTAVPGIEIAEYFPKIAQSMKNVSIIRSMAGKEAAHARGTYHLHTGRRLTGTLKFPSFGSIVANEIGDPDFDLPNFVSIGKTVSSGFLGVRVAPFVVNRPGELPANVSTVIEKERQRKRLALLEAQDADFEKAGASALVQEHETLYHRASRLMASPGLKAFQLESASKSDKLAYGKTPFGQGLLVARQLVEAGVPFVEVRRGGWDMHSNLWRNMPRSAEDVDHGLTQLMTDLKQRGMFEKTLIICMGEFGRTPKINARPPAPGRDHWARNFATLLAGGGIKGGHAVGKTDVNGQEIIDRPVQVEDLFQTLCKAMGVNADKQFFSISGRPLSIVDGGEPVSEILA